ncbi:MAG: glycosyltransferase family 39 protein [Planctomycetes bacterium]|nr:glycosyltransferase family 39 protein [Planctomycetota bacterium]
MTATTEPPTAPPTEYVDLQDSSILRLRTHGPVEPFTTRQLGLLLLITLVAGFLRLHDLGTWSLWVDEAHTYRDATLPLRGENGFFAQYRIRYPSSFLMLRGLLDTGLLAGISEGWLRLPFALCGIVTVPLLALAGNLFVGRSAALLAAFMLALNPWHIYWSQNARGYVMVFFFAVLAGAALWVALVRRHRGWLVAGVLAVLAGGSFHPTCYLLLAPAAAYPLWLHVQTLQGRRFWMTTLGAVLVLAVVPLVVQHLPPFAEFLKAKPDASVVHFAQTVGFYFRVPLVATAAFGVWLLYSGHMQAQVRVLACWFLVPLLVMSVLSLSVVKATARYAFCALPAVLLLASATSLRLGEVLADGLGRRIRGKRWIPLAMLPAILCLDMAAYDYLYFRAHHGDRAQWREAGEHILRASAGKPVQVMVVPAPSLQYYLRPDHWRRPGVGAVDPHPERQVVEINKWDVFRDKEPKGSEFYGGRGFVRRAIASARDAGRELWFAATLPELHEADLDGSLYANMQDLLELSTVLPCWVGPKDESIWIWRVRDPARGTKVGAAERKTKPEVPPTVAGSGGGATSAGADGRSATPKPADTKPAAAKPAAAKPAAAKPAPAKPVPAKPAEKAGAGEKPKTTTAEPKSTVPKDAAAGGQKPGSPKPGTSAKPPAAKPPAGPATEEPARPSGKPKPNAAKPPATGSSTADGQRRTGGTGS